MSRNNHVLVKTTRAGWRLFYRGQTADVEAADGQKVRVVESSPFDADARQFPDAASAAYRACILNDEGIGGAPWTVQPAYLVGTDSHLIR